MFRNLQKLFYCSFNYMLFCLLLYIQFCHWLCVIVTGFVFSVYFYCCHCSFSIVLWFQVKLPDTVLFHLAAFVFQSFRFSLCSRKKKGNIIKFQKIFLLWNLVFIQFKKFLSECHFFLYLQYKELFDFCFNLTYKESIV